ncbi:amino acid ABC transporter substrate-binding protein [Azospirillum sp. TSO22-1]|uniref:amino acid ABC transporter substrate-binding protein n=1 Tax=Azospirillum sp. TSO22-1 TaxID=716789 RepID=UPI000D60844A|nr:amino acid ABC transporter substrate-binding protein [Azospirillum sp. TSO22-1]PWC40389.1 amino acid ABC transporter substrate-binding protein [Azospirillum sp. TSO22-1]
MPDRKPVSLRLLAPFAAALALIAGTAQAGPTLDAVKARSTVKCGVLNSPGGSAPDANGEWRGFNADFCRAIAAALFNDPRKVEFVATTRQQRFTAIQSGEVDVLIAGVTQTVTRALQLGLHFGPIVLHDGQGFLVPKALKVAKATELDGATVCTMPGTTTELNVTDFFRLNKISYKPVVAEEFREVLAAFTAGRCDVLTQDASALAITRSQLPKPDDYVLLPERISKEPIAPAVRFGDDQWQEIVNWTIWATIQAEEFGIARDTVDGFAGSPDPSVRRFLGIDPGIGEAIRLDPRWAYNIVKAVGNYGEIFERNYGKDSPLKFARGPNELVQRGGLIVSPPFR